MKKRLISDELIGFAMGVVTTGLVAYYLMENPSVISVIKLMTYIFLPNFIVMMKMWEN